MVFRVHKTKQFTTICNSCIFDGRLTLKAKGLLITMLALPEDWNYSIAGIVSIVKEGESAIRAALKELKEYGYVNVSRIIDDKGKVVDWQYDIHESPVSCNQDTDYPVVENPHVDNPVVENQAIQNTNKQSTDVLNTDKQTKKDISSVPSDISKEKKRFTGVNPSKEEVEAYIRDKGFHVSAKNIIDYYTNSGDLQVWKMKDGSLVRDWKRCVCTCERNWRDKSGISRPQPQKHSEKEDYEKLVRDHQDKFDSQYEEMLRRHNEQKAAI